jgi:DNA-binding transcriptional MerR regulator
MTGKFLRTSDLAQAVGVHPNTVRLYEEWGLLPPVERSAVGYRLFTQRHLDCLRLARLIYAADYPGTELRASGREIIRCAVIDDWAGAREMALAHLASVQAELEQANTAADVLEHWAQSTADDDGEEALAIGEASQLVGASLDAIRNWERDGLITVPRNASNGYRRFGKRDIERLRIIRMLSHSGYSHMAMLRMFRELDEGRISDLREALDVQREDEDIMTAADHWLTTLAGQERLSHQVVHLIDEQIARKT